MSQHPREDITEGGRPLALLHVLEERMQKTSQQIETYRYVQDLTNEGRKEKLEAKLGEMTSAWTDLNKPVTSKDELQEEITTIGEYDAVLEGLNTKDLSHLDVDQLDRSKLRFFFEDQILNELESTRNHRNFAETIGRTILDTDTQILKEARWSFDKHILDTQAEIRRLEKLPKNNPERGQIENLKAELEAVQAQEDEWVNKEIHAKKKEDLKRKLIRKLDSTTLERLKNTFEEARHIRVEKMYNYASFELENLEAQFEQAEDTLEGDQINKYRAIIAKAKSDIQDRKAPSIDGLKNFIDGLRNARSMVYADSREAREFNKKRPGIEIEVAKKQKRIQKAMLEIGNRSKGKKKKDLNSEGAGPIAMEGYLRMLGLIQGKKIELKDGGSIDLKTMLEDTNGIVNQVKQLSNSQLKELDEQLETITESLCDPLDAEKAHKTIEELDKAKDLTAIKKALAEKLGNEHLEYITEADFGQYKQYTESGFMVYYQRGQEWKIIINETALKGAEVKKVKDQLTHELLHVEFERGGMTQDKDGNPISFKEKLIQELRSYPEWPALELAFEQWVKDTNQKDSKGGDEWPIEDKASEIFAMQREWGQREIEEGKGSGTDGALNSAEILNNLLYKFNKAGINKVFNEKIGEDTKTRILGYKEGFPKEDEGPAAIGGMVDPNDPTQALPTYTSKGPAVDTTKQRENQDTIEKFTERLKRLEAAPHIKQIQDAPELVKNMTRFNNEMVEYNRRGRIDAVANKIAGFEHDLAQLEGVVQELSVKEENSDMSFFRNLWNNTTFLTAQDFVMAGKQFFEYWERRMNRRVEDHAARINMAIFGGSGMGLEATARQQKTEAAEVGEWEGNLDKLDPIQLGGLLKNLAQSSMPDRDRFKAILRTLAKKGRINWLEQDIWKVLNKLQKKVYFRENDPELLSNPNLLRQKYLKAFGNFYDQDEFPNLERQNASTFESEKSSQEAIHKKTPTILAKRMNDILARHRNDEQKANPHEYESLIDYCINDGRANGENALFHLIAGMAYGILPPDRGLNLSSKYASKWPPIQWLESAPPSQEFFIKLCKNNFNDDFVAGNVNREDGGKQFKKWFFTQAINKFAISDRVQKSAKRKEWDPDWGRTITCMGDAEIIRQHFKGRGGVSELQPPAIAQSYVGTLQYLEENAADRNYTTRADFARIAGNMIMHEGIVDGTAYKSAGDDYSRLVDNNRVPNEASMGNYGGKTLLQHRQKMRDFLNHIHPTAFRRLRGQDLVDKGKKQTEGQKAAQDIINAYPDIIDAIPSLDPKKIDSIDQVFDKIREIMSYIFNNMSPEQYNGLLDYVVEQSGKLAPDVS